MLDVLAAAVRTVPRFKIALTNVQWFGDSVVWLPPEPDQPFRALTNAVWRQFPQTPPFGGACQDVVPHLTVGNDAPQKSMRQAAIAVSEHLPIRASVTAVHVICGSRGPDSWQTISVLPLGK
ncbi:MAG: 2'-5' RNA ligase family protein [Geodermatophilaceae bacterium]